MFYSAISYAICKHHITYGSGVPEHSAGIGINVLCNIDLCFPASLKWRYKWGTNDVICDDITFKRRIFSEIYSAEAVFK